MAGRSPQNCPIPKYAGAAAAEISRCDLRHKQQNPAPPLALPHVHLPRAGAECAGKIAIAQFKDAATKGEIAAAQCDRSRSARTSPPCYGVVVPVPFEPEPERTKVPEPVTESAPFPLIAPVSSRVFAERDVEHTRPGHVNGAGTKKRLCCLKGAASKTNACPTLRPDSRPTKTDTVPAFSVRPPENVFVPVRNQRAGAGFGNAAASTRLTDISTHVQAVAAIDRPTCRYKLAMPSGSPRTTLAEMVCNRFRAGNVLAVTFPPVNVKRPTGAGCNGEAGFRRDNEAADIAVSIEGQSCSRGKPVPIVNRLRPVKKR